VDVIHVLDTFVILVEKPQMCNVQSRYSLSSARKMTLPVSCSMRTAGGFTSNTLCGKGKQNKRCHTIVKRGM